MATPVVSVVIPVFNGAPFVSEAVTSVWAQTVKEVEIIVVDDGSTDGTQAVLAELERTAGITCFQQDHGGPARSRNRGIEAARGELVALLDCDDVWLFWLHDPLFEVPHLSINWNQDQGLFELTGSAGMIGDAGESGK